MNSNVGYSINGKQKRRKWLSPFRVTEPMHVSLPTSLVALQW